MLPEEILVGLKDGSRMYVWLTRGDFKYASYTKASFDTRVSLYSISSPLEWFAEQYSEYYRMSKNSPRIDAAMKTKLDEIDRMKWDPSKVASDAGTGSKGTLSSKEGTFDATKSDGVRHETPGAEGDGDGGAGRPPFPW